MVITDEHVRQFEKNGFAIIRNVIDADLIGEVREHVDWLMKKYPELRPEHLHHPLIRNDAFWVRLVTDERILAIVERILGPNLACFTAHYICKPAIDGQPVLWHQDGAYWKLDPMDALSVWLAVDDSTTENGCLRMIPGSHAAPLLVPELHTDSPNMLYSTMKQAVVDDWLHSCGEADVVLKPGDISIHHPNTIHCSGPNRSPHRRCGLDIGFIKTSAAISNKELYLDPLLVKGQPQPGVNKYRRWPTYQADESIRFRGCDQWNDQLRDRDVGSQMQAAELLDEAPIVTAKRMIDRLRAGTVKE